MSALAQVLVTASSCDAVIADRVSLAHFDAWLLTTLVYGAIAGLFAWGSDYFSTFERAKRRRERAISKRAASYMALGMDPIEAVGRASSEMEREARETLAVSA